MVQLGELVMVLDLHRQGLSVTAVAHQLSLDRKTLRKYIARGLDRRPTRRPHRASIVSLPSPPSFVNASPPTPRSLVCDVCGVR